MADISQNILRAVAEAERIRAECGAGRVRYPKGFQREVVALLGCGVANKRIATVLKITPWTLSYWRKKWQTAQKQTPVFSEVRLLSSAAHSNESEQNRVMLKSPRGFEIAASVAVVERWLKSGVL